jgi:hypothetical protein
VSGVLSEVSLSFPGWGTLLTVLLFATVSITARAFQSLFVIHRHWAGIPFAAMSIALLDGLLFIVAATTTNLWVLIAWGMGGTLGCFTAMSLHRKKRP